VSWTGWPYEGYEIIRQLARTQFSPVDELIFDYERIPVTTEVQPARDPISTGETMTIELAEIRDRENRPPQSWQRVVVTVEHGEILNGEYNEVEDQYAFEVGEGGLQIQYRAPDECEAKRESIVVYNSCDWGQRCVVPLRTTDRKHRIGEVKFDIEPSQDWIADITYRQIIDFHDEDTTAERQVMVAIKARLKPRRKREQMATKRPPALRQIDEVRQRMKDGAYDDVLHPTIGAQMEQAMQRLEQLAGEIGGVHNYASYGSKVTLLDVFDRTDSTPERGEKWHWSVQQSEQMPLNIGLDTSVPGGKYRVSVGTKTPDWRDQEDVPVAYQYHASRRSFPPDPNRDFDCSGRTTLNSLLLTLNLLTDVPDEKMTFTGEEDGLNGTHTWSKYGGGSVRPGHDVFDSDDCKESYPLLLPSQETLNWSIRRVCK
jgi:hypothetical protein